MEDAQDKLTGEQTELLAALQAEFPKAAPHFLLRVARHRKWDLEKSKKLAATYLAWRDSHRADELTWSDFPSLENEPAMSFYVAPSGQPIWVFNAGLWTPSAYPKEEVELWLVAMLEAILRLPEVQERGIIMVGDVSGFGWSNFDPALEKLWLHTIQNQVPLSLRRLVMYRPGWIMSTLMAIVTPWMKPKLRARLARVHTPDQIAEVVPLSDLPRHYGGELDDIDAVDCKKQLLDAWISERKS